MSAELLLLWACVAGGFLTAMHPAAYAAFASPGSSPSVPRFTSALWLLGYVVGLSIPTVLLAGAVGAAGDNPSLPHAPGVLAFLVAALGWAALGVLPLRLPASLTTRLQGASNALTAGLSAPLAAAPGLGAALLTLICLAFHPGGAARAVTLALAFLGGLGVALVARSLRGERMPMGGAWLQVVAMLLAAAMWGVAAWLLTQAVPSIALALQQWRHTAVCGGALLFVGCGAGTRVLAARHLEGSGSRGMPIIGAALLASGSLLVGLAMSRGPFIDGPPNIVWESSVDAAIAQGRLEHRPVMLDFTAEWCAGCLQLERQTYVDTNVRRAALRFIPVKIDCTNLDDRIQALFSRYGILGLPAVVFIDSTGALLTTPRLTGFVGPSRFLEILAQVK